jgi:hypothetical protein
VTRLEHETSQRVRVKLGLRYEQEVQPYGVAAVQNALTRTEFRPDETTFYVLHDPRKQS